ncbi:2'-5' RNA ligase family protein [Hymenobacter sp. BT683]|uniref:2'-5' RNA ligase family protein n=1 Tax=Hymenobacter jeongseonensis TaxID=2791027 RepID=A0ABS0IFX2_9BACT|nr:2'-5' RNA ligase family protein [Hymenobacter jeongseonensis]MBF9237256.1 2'-5' RNA ligase family protein [Hymenobacter jeongseonensis]
MFAITSLLNPRNAMRINRIVKGLETQFGLDDVQDTPDPHLTYLLTGTRRLNDLKAVLRDVAATTPPFSAYTTGLGVFPGDNPVIYIPVLRSNDLNLLHQRVLDVTAPMCRAGSYYSPDRWLPHLSLALHDTTPDLLGPVLRHLNQETYNLRLNVNNLALLRKKGDLFVREEVFELTGKP